MTKQIVELEVPGAGTVFMEVEDTAVLEDMALLNRQEIKQRLRSAFVDAMSIIETMARGIVLKMRELDEEVGPKEFVVEFGVKLDTEVGAVLASSTTGASIVVKLKWERSEPAP